MKLPISTNKYFRKQSSFWKQIIPARRFKNGFFCLVMLLVIGTAGCGKKALPLPPPEEIPPGITDLTADLKGRILTLSWSIPKGDNADLIIGYKIYLSAVPLEETDCRDCPVTFRLLDDVIIDESSTMTSGNGKMFYSQTLEAENPEGLGTRKNTVEYQYKVVGYTEYNVRSPDSNVIIVNHPVKTETVHPKGNREE